MIGFWIEVWFPHESTLRFPICSTSIQPPSRHAQRSVIIEISNPREVSLSEIKHHVRTDFTKATLKMLTAIEAAPILREKSVVMNSVSPRYRSAVSETEKRRKASGFGTGGGKVRGYIVRFG